MADSKKRKERSGDYRERADNRNVKKSKGGSGGKWQTPHQKAKLASRGSGQIEPGDVGIWATCARNQEGRATTELKEMFEECAERFYGIHSNPDKDDDEDVSVDDIEASIQKEVASIGDKKSAIKLFSPVHLDLQCVLFFKTRQPIDPVDFVHRICEEIFSNPGIRKMKYVNRLTPMTSIGKATEKGLEEVGKDVLGTHFNLAGEDIKTSGEHKPSHTYAIRPTIRNHNTLERDAVIKQVASMIGDSHKVNLTAPEKTVIVEIYRTVCGLSVVGSDYDQLKRFNLAELYSLQGQTLSKIKADSQTGTKPESVKTNEACSSH